MTWITIEGVDRVGKSTISELFKAKGYEVVHSHAPDRKYINPNYVGPSYLEDILTKLLELSGKDVVFDRSAFGELFWPQIYNRKQLLSDDDIEIIKEIEDQNNVQRFLMVDPNVEAHWKRCVDNKEPLTRDQFNQANLLFENLVAQHGFKKVTKDEFILPTTNPDGADRTPVNEARLNDPVLPPVNQTKDARGVQMASIEVSLLTPEQIRLAEANAINEVLLKPIIKQKGNYYQSIEDKIRLFLNAELKVLLGTNSPQVQNSLTDQEILFIRALLNNAKKR